MTKGFLEYKYGGKSFRTPIFRYVVPSVQLDFKIVHTTNIKN